MRSILRNVTRSGEIFHNENCKLFKQSLSKFEQRNITTVKIESEFIAPNHAIFENQTWTNVQMYAHQRNKKLNDLIINLNALTSTYKKRAKLIKVMDSNPFPFIWDSFKNMLETINFFILISVLIIVTVILFLFMLCYITCGCRR